jgi:ABC-type multidrug transport system fused ATPase/permease subunit
LFDASLRDNLTLFDDAIDDDHNRSVIDELGLGLWYSALPHGLDTMVSGSGLSAGEAQVLACARILLRDPDVVIMDEASSRLDPATERLVQVAMQRLLQGRTGIIIAHRLDTVALADDLLVLQDGRVHENGPRLALAADPDSRFAALLRLDAEEVRS